MGPIKVIPLQVRVNLEVMAKKEYSTLSITPELDSHWMEFSVIPKTLLLGELLPLSRGYSQPILIPINRFIKSKVGNFS